MIPNENAKNAWRVGFALGYSKKTYTRDWHNPYITMKARWAMVQGYETAWKVKRQILKDEEQ